MKENFIIFLWLTFFSCTNQVPKNKLYNVQADIRFGDKFYSIKVAPTGDSYIVKGTGTNYTDTLLVMSADTSNVFKLDSVSIFFERLEQLRRHPINGPKRWDAPRVEIYYHNEKIYDAYKWDTTFWKLFSPIMEQIPVGFNPFRANDRPFD